MGLRLDEELIEALDAWRERQRVAPSRTSVIETALWEWLERNQEEGEDGEEKR